MNQQSNCNRINIPLYHGTSSLFLEDIIKYGLGGQNPVVSWHVLEFGKKIYPLVEKHLSNSYLEARIGSFKLMVEQKSGIMNFQHGDTYVSPSKSTAIRYAVNKRYGSEILTYTLDFLDELIRQKIKGVTDDLYKHYPQLFNLLDISPAPLLFKIDNIDNRDQEDLVAEDGSNATQTLDYIHEVLKSSPNDADELLQQSNFRLCRPISVKDMKIWFIHVKEWRQMDSHYTIYPLSIT